MRYIDPALSARRAAAGRAGGYATFLKYGREQMVLWAKKGGRPHSLTLEELMSRVGSRKEKGRGNGCPPLNTYPPAVARALSRYKKGGEPAASAPLSSPEGVPGEISFSR